MNDAFDSAVVVSVVGMLIMLVVGGADSLINHTTEEMRVGMMVIGIFLFFGGGLLCWMVEP